MADINDTQQSEVIRLTGGNESFTADVNANNNVSVSSSLKTGGVFGVLLVQSNAPVEIKVGAQKFANRELLTLYNASNKTYYWGLDNTVTAASGLPIMGSSEKTWLVNDVVSIWVIADGGTNNNARVLEAR